MVVSGTIVVPMVGFVIPILCDFKFNSEKMSSHIILWKLFAVLVVIVINIYSIMSILNDASTT